MRYSKKGDKGQTVLSDRQRVLLRAGLGKEVTVFVPSDMARMRRLHDRELVKITRGTRPLPYVTTEKGRSALA